MALPVHFQTFFSEQPRGADSLHLVRSPKQSVFEAMAQLFKPIQANRGYSHSVEVDPFNQLPNGLSGEAAQVANEQAQTTAASYLQPRTRRRLTDYQKQVLEEIFAASPYLTSVQYMDVACGLGIPKPALQNWFKNKRYRLKLKKETEKNKTMPAIPVVLSHYIQHTGPAQNLYGKVSSAIYYPQSYNFHHNHEEMDSFISPAASSSRYY